MQRLCSFAAAVLAVAVARPAIAGSGCFAHRPKYIEGKIEVTYEAGCTGHDEPELAPISSAPGSARDLTGQWCFPPTAPFPWTPWARRSGSAERLSEIACIENPCTFTFASGPHSPSSRSAAAANAAAAVSVSRKRRFGRDGSKMKPWDS